MNEANEANEAVVVAAEEWDGALTLADLDTRDRRHLEDARPIVHHPLAAKPIRTFQVAETEDATTIVVVPQLAP